MALRLLRRGAGGLKTVKGRIIILATALIITATLTAIADDIVEIRLRGHYFSEPATVQITVAVEPAAANRVLRIEADGDRMYRSSEVTLTGKGDARFHTVEFKNLPAGDYELRAEVLSNDKVLGMASQELVVAGIGGR